MRNSNTVFHGEWLYVHFYKWHLTDPHVLFEDVCSSLHFNHTVDDQFTVGCQEVSPFMQSFNLYCLIILLPIWDETKCFKKVSSGTESKWDPPSTHLYLYLCYLCHHPGLWRHGSGWRRAVQTVASPLGNRLRAPGVPCHRTPSGGWRWAGDHRE